MFNNHWDGEIALRLGYTWSRHLLYAKVGRRVWQLPLYGWHDDFPTVHGCPNGGTCSVSFSKTLLGLLLGAGWEYAFLNNWSVKVEYNYINYASHNLP